MLVRIVDTGIGIPPDAAKRLFRAFSQADSATTRKYGGTGLGLAISLRLISLMGGSIGLESEPGRGSTFWFIAPAKPAARTVAPAGTEVPAQPPSQPLELCHQDRILVVEDNPVNQLVVSRMLQNLGYFPTVVSGGEVALEALAGQQFDLIFMDCQMPGMDGYETAAEIRRRERGARRAPIVALTANAVDGDRERCLAAGMDDYLAKPLRLSILEATIHRWLAPACRSVA